MMIKKSHQNRHLVTQELILILVNQVQMMIKINPQKHRLPAIQEHTHL